VRDREEARDSVRAHFPSCRMYEVFWCLIRCPCPPQITAHTQCRSVCFPGDRARVHSLFVRVDKLAPQTALHLGSLSLGCSHCLSEVMRCAYSWRHTLPTMLPCYYATMPPYLLLGYATPGSNCRRLHKGAVSAPVRAPLAFPSIPPRIHLCTLRGSHWVAQDRNRDPYHIQIS